MISILQMTLFVEIRTDFAGCFDSPAAMATISVPINEKITTVIPIRTELKPVGMNPPLPNRLDVPGVAIPGYQLKITQSPNIRNATILTTLMRENQYSNSPKDLTENKFVMVRETVSISAINQSGKSGIQYWIMAAPAIASIAITTVQKNQY